MKITLKGGTVVEKVITSANCMGYHAEQIEMTRHDFRRLREIVSRNPSVGIIILMQLEERFE